MVISPKYGANFPANFYANFENMDSNFSANFQNMDLNFPANFLTISWTLGGLRPPKPPCLTGGLRPRDPPLLISLDMSPKSLQMMPK